jgi:hypothetical protein
MQEVARLVLDLPPAHDELVFLQLDVELIGREPGDGNHDAEPLRSLVSPRQPLDVVGRIPVARGLCDSVERLLDLVEPEEEGVPERRSTSHALKPSVALRGTGTLTASPSRRKDM